MWRAFELQTDFGERSSQLITVAVADAVLARYPLQRRFFERRTIFLHLPGTHAMPHMGAVPPLLDQATGYIPLRPLALPGRELGRAAFGEGELTDLRCFRPSPSPSPLGVPQ